MEIGILNARLYYNFHLRRLSIISHRDIELSIKTSVFSTFFFLFISLDKVKKGRKKNDRLIIEIVCRFSNSI